MSIGVGDLDGRLCVFGCGVEFLDAALAELIGRLVERVRMIAMAMGRAASSLQVEARLGDLTDARHDR